MTIGKGAPEPPYPAAGPGDGAKQTMKPEIFEGSAVISQKGRDKGRVFVVLYLVDADFVMVADGDTRKLDRMKKKRRMHVRALPVQFPEAVEKYRAGRLKDSDLRTLLWPYRKKDAEEKRTDSGREEPFVQG